MRGFGFMIYAVSSTSFLSHGVLPTAYKPGIVFLLWAMIPAVIGVLAMEVVSYSRVPSLARLDSSVKRRKISGDSFPRFLWWGVGCSQIHAAAMPVLAYRVSPGNTSL